MKNNFDIVSPFYELLKRMVFGEKLYDAENRWLQEIESRSKVLVLGGGNGHLLRNLGKDCIVDYVDLSAVMLSNASKQPYQGTVNFMQEDFLEIRLKGDYDWVIANFFLDVFDSQNLQKAIQKISAVLSAEGKLIVTDFEDNQTLLSTLLLKTMHLFFFITTGLESKRLKPIKLALHKGGFEPKLTSEFSGGKIFSTIFIKNGNLPSYEVSL